MTGQEATVIKILAHITLCGLVAWGTVEYYPAVVDFLYDAIDKELAFQEQINAEREWKREVYNGTSK